MPDCTRCPLHEDVHHVCMSGSGPRKSRVMIVGEAPGEREDAEGVPFVGRAGQKLNSILEEVGLDRSELYVTNAVKCRPPDNRTPKKKEIEACQHWMKKEIQRVNPTHVLLLGSVALRSVLGLDGIKSLRGKDISLGGIVYLPVFHPAYILRVPRSEGVFKADLRYFAQLLGKGGKKKERVKWYLVNSVARLELALKDIRSTKYRVSFDLETTSLESHNPDTRIVMMGVGTRDYQWCFPIHHSESILGESIIDEVLDALVGKDIVTHNGKFDARYILAKRNRRINIWFDTMIAAHLTDENRSIALDSLAAQYYNAPSWDIPLAEKQGNAPALKIARYLALDLYYTRKLSFKLNEELKKDPLVDRVFWEMKMPAQDMLIDSEHNGTYVEPTKLADGEKYWTERRDNALKQLNKLCPTDRTYKNKKTKQVVRGWNWGSPQQVATVLFEKLKLTPLEKTPGGANSTSESVLLRLAHQHKVPKLILEWREADKQLNTFIHSWANKLDERSCLHPTFKLTGTVTGRLSCEDPNLQQVPRDERIRSLITAPPGWTFVEADYSQIELRIVAHLSDDPELKLAYQTGQDIHTITVQRIMGISNPSKEERKKGKAINFGFIYGMGYRKFITYARDNYEQDFEEHEAKGIRKGFFRTYRALPSWHERQKIFAHRNGYVRSLCGTARHLPILLDAPMDYEELTPEQREADRQAINSPVQCFASNLNLASATELSQKLPRDQLRVTGLVHDASLFWVRTKMLKETLPIIKKTMESPRFMKRFGIQLSVPLVVDLKVGNWGAGEEIKNMKEYLARL